MKIKINGKDITEDIEILRASTVDRAYGIDILDATISDINKKWQIWDIKEEDSIEIIKKGFSTGEMFINKVTIINGKCEIKASALKRSCRKSKTFTLENSTYMKLAETVAHNNNLKLKVYDIKNYEYDRVDCFQKTDIAFLMERGILEGYNLKISNNSIVIYDIYSFENKKSVRDFTTDDFIYTYKFERQNLDVYKQCIIEYYSDELILSQATDERIINGSVIRPTLRISSIGEGERFARNILKFRNKGYITTYFVVQLDEYLAGGSCINIEEVGKYSGKYFIEEVKHDFFNNKSIVKARKI